MLTFSTINLAQNMPFSTAENVIMNIREVADYLKVTERTIYRLAGDKQIPAFKMVEVGYFLRQTLMGGSKINLRWNQRALRNSLNSSLTPII
jgi:excisionase family DNA binding protein